MAAWLLGGLGIVVYVAIGVYMLMRMRRAGFVWWGWGALCGGWPVLLICLGIMRFAEETGPNTWSLRR